MTLPQAATIALCALATMLTRYLPFFVFGGKKTPAYIRYLGQALPAAIFGMLVVYCFKNVSVLAGSHAVPELLAAAFTAALHVWRRQMLLSIAGGTVFYMLLVQLIF